MKKKNILIITAVILSVLAIAVLSSAIYVQNIFVPKKLKPLLLESISGATARKVDIGDASFSIFKGVVLKDIKIYEQDGQKEFPGNKGLEERLGLTSLMVEGCVNLGYGRAAARACRP